jgi:hypothetical protein
LDGEGREFAMTVSIARYLKDFGEPPPPPVLIDDLGSFAMDMDDFPAIAEEPAVDIEAERAEAHAEGHAAASSQLQQDFAQERIQLLAQHEEALAELRQRYETDLAALMAEKFRDIAIATAQSISDQTAQILSPLLEEALANKAVSDLADLIRTSMLEGDLGTLTVRGPAELFEKLKTTLGDTPLRRHVEAADLDITVDIGETALVTRISAWSASLKKVLG